MKRYANLPLSLPRVDLGLIPKGYQGTQATLAHIKSLIRKGAKDFYVRQKSIDILLEKSVKAKDYLGEIRAIFEWVQKTIRYTKDPFRVEMLHSARRLLELRAGDCDDMTILLGSMLESIGHPVRLVVTGPDPLRPKLFSHIYLEVFHQGHWIPLDATMPHPMGWEPKTFIKQVIHIERSLHMLNQHQELHRSTDLSSLPDWLTNLIVNIHKGSIKPKDQRIKRLLGLLHQRQLQHQNRWLIRTLEFIHQRGLSHHPRPELAKRVENLMHHWKILSAALDSSTSQQNSTYPTITIPVKSASKASIKKDKILQARPVRPVKVSPVPGVTVRRVATINQHSVPSQKPL